MGELSWSGSHDTKKLFECKKCENTKMMLYMEEWTD